MISTLTPLVQAVGWALIHFLWQGALIGGIAALALLVLRNARPQLRYFVSCAALALCIFVPASGILHSMSLASVPAEVLADIGGGLFDVAGGLAEIPDGRQRGAGIGGVTLRDPDLAAWLQAHLHWIVGAWLMVAALLALRVALGLVWIERISKQSHRPDRAWQSCVDQLALRFKVGRRIALRVVDGLNTPVAAGWLRPVILVPASMVTGMPADLLEALLAHEMAHIKRLDYLVNLLQSAVEVLLFYHPAVWWLSKQVRNEREQIADDMAVHVLGEPRKLALALQSLELMQSQCNLAPAAAGGNLMERIKRLVRPDTQALSWKPAAVMAALAMLCAGYATPALTEEAPSEPVKAASSTTPAAVAPVAPVTLPTAPVRSGKPAPVANAAAVLKSAPSAAAAVPAPKMAASAISAAPAAKSVAPAAPAYQPVNAQVMSDFSMLRPDLPNGMNTSGARMIKDSCDKAKSPNAAAYAARSPLTTVLNVLVGLDGKPKSISLAQSSGVAELDEATIAYQSTCSYEPGSVGGRPAELYTVALYGWSYRGRANGDNMEINGKTFGRINAQLEAATCRKPLYPEESLFKRRTGTVQMEFVVSAEGKVKEAKVLKSSGTEELDTAAVEALRICDFKPAQQDGSAVEGVSRMSYAWMLGM